MNKQADQTVYERQGFGKSLDLAPPAGLLIVDFINGFVDAMCHGFRPVIVEDCVGDRSIAQHEANLFDLKMKYTEVMRLRDVEALNLPDGNRK